MPVHVGTSGWQYRDWRGVLYPPGVPQRRWLEHYAERFPTVENNASFYRLPSRDVFADWRARTPQGLVMAVKASRYLTHIRRLRDPAEPVERLLQAAAGLGDRLGPVLIQLPPNLPADPGALEACLGEFSRFRVTADGRLVPAGPVQALERPAGPVPALERPAGQRSVGQPPAGDIRVAVEFRHPSWCSDEIRQLLERHNVASCWADRLGHPVTPLWRTADWGYLRFHEGAARPWPRYGSQALRSWVRRAADAWPDDADVFAYFNNDQHGAAVHDAAAYASIARRAGRHVTAAGQPCRSAKGFPGPHP